jgi:hypothetical protein
MESSRREFLKLASLAAATMKRIPIERRETCASESSASVL